MTSFHDAPHPRLYLTASDLPTLRTERDEGIRNRIRINLLHDAEWCLTRSLRHNWIAPASPDPRYENIYDRFYAIMYDLPVTEHLGFAFALSGDNRFGEAARQWTLNSCRIWKPEADGAPDGGKAYAVCRLLKGVATGYDLAWDRFTETERAQIRDTLTRIADRYYNGYFTTPEHAGPDFHTHHAIVEYASFGVTALTLLGESPDAGRWIEAVIAKFERDLLPRGLAEDGAQVEGGSFWASTMQYRLMFMDALLRVTGHDLFSPYERFMKDTHALAGIVATHTETDLFDHASFMLQPSYAQLDYYAPVLLALSRFYDRPQCRRLALWDQTLGGLQRTRFVTPNGEHLLFSFGGYAYLWYTDGPVDIAPGSPMAWHFPSVDEAYLRDGWEPDGMAAGVRRGEMVLHAGGRPFLVESNPWQQPPIPRKVNAISDNGRYAEIVCGDDTNRFCLALTRPGCLSVERQSAEPWVWRCAGDPVVEGDTIVWPDGVRLIVQAGILTPFEPRVFTDTLSVANGLLVLPDPAPVSWTQVTVTPPEDGNIVLKCKR